MLASLFDKAAGPGLQLCEKETPRLVFSVKFAKCLRTSILKNICEKLILFVSPQNTITNSSGELGLDQTLTERKVSIFLA